MIPADIAGEFRPSLRASVAAEEVDGDVVLYDESTRSVHVLNGTAAAIASCFDGAGTIRDIAGEVAEAFGQPLDDVLAAVLDVARTLGSASLLDGVEGEVAPADPDDEPPPPAWLADPPSR
jgi:hypothetical protein